jgi:hypothetical protein
MIATLAGDTTKPGAAYFAPPRIPFESTEVTDPQLVMADGDRRRSKRRLLNNEPDAEKGPAVSNFLHRTTRRKPRYRTPTPEHEVRRREEELGLRGETPVGLEWGSDREGISDAESESDGSDKDYQE